MPDEPKLLNFCVGSLWPPGHENSDGESLRIIHTFGVQVQYGSMKTAEHLLKIAQTLTGTENSIYTLVPLTKPVENVTPEFIEATILSLLSKKSLSSVELIEEVLMTISGSTHCTTIRLADWDHGNDIRRKMSELMNRGVIVKSGPGLTLSAASPTK